MADTAEFNRLLNTGHSFIITCHKDPDADALGSEMALALYLQAQGKTAVIINSDPVPNSLEFLDTEKIIRTADEFSGLPEHDLFISLDTAVTSRFPGLVPLITEGTDMFAVDHHIPGPDNLPGIIDINASSTGEILFRFFKETGSQITPEIARPLLYAVGADTGWMQFENTTPQVVAIMAELAALADIPMSRAYAGIYYHWTEERFRLYLDIMQTLEIRGTTALIYCNQDFLDKYPSISSISEVSDNLINDLKRLKDCTVALFLKQKEERDGYRVSLRSKGDVNVQHVASRFSGGGHRAASGCTITGMGLEEVKNALIREISKSS